MDTSLAIASRSSDSASHVERLHRGHERRAERREERREARRDDRDEAFAQLKIKVQQTVHGLTQPAADEATGDDGDSSSVETEFKLSIKVSGSGDGSAFAGALQSFTEALFSALQTLYGGPAQSATPATPVSAPAPADATAIDTTTNEAATPAATDTTDAAATTTPAVEDTPIKTTTETPAPPTTLSAPPAGNSTTSAFTLRLRLAYSSFDSQLGPLTNRLAQPGVGSDVPEVGSMFGDLTERFSDMLAAAKTSSSGGDAEHPNLASFLAALASSFGGGGSSSSSSYTLQASLYSRAVYATA